MVQKHVDPKMRQLIKDTKIDFMGRSRLALMISGALLVICLLSILVRGMNWGLDFTGGTVVEAGLSRSRRLGGLTSSTIGGRFWQR